METGILQIKEYGRIEITLRQQMDARGITRNRMARMIDVRYEVIDADILARLCFVLGCGAGDLIRYVARADNEAAPG